MYNNKALCSVQSKDLRLVNESLECYAHWQHVACFNTTAPIISCVSSQTDSIVTRHYWLTGVNASLYATGRFPGINTKSSSLVIFAPQNRISNNVTLKYVMCVMHLTDTLATEQIKCIAVSFLHQNLTFLLVVHYI